MFIFFIFFFYFFFFFVNFFMGGKNDKGIKYELPLNINLNDNIRKSIINSDYNKELEKFKRLLYKNVKSDIKKSNFNENFKKENIKYRNIISLTNLIYSKSSNSILKKGVNRTLYESIFNYDTIEKKSEGYIKFTKEISNKMKLFISGDRNLDNNSNDNIYDNNSGIFETLRISIKEPNLSENSKKEINTSNKGNYNIDDYIIKNNYINPNPSFKNPNLFNESISNIVSEDQNIHSIIQSNTHLNSHKEIIPIPKMNKKARSTSKKKHFKDSKKKPVLNIKLDLRDLFKQDIKEKSHLSPSQRYTTKNNSIKYNIIQNPLSNIKSMGAQSLSNRYANDKDFLDIVDRLTQPNKLESEIIRNRNSIRKNQKMKIIKKNK